MSSFKLNQNFDQARASPKTRSALMVNTRYCSNSRPSQSQPKQMVLGSFDRYNKQHNRSLNISLNRLDMLTTSNKKNISRSPQRGHKNTGRTSSILEIFANKQLYQGGTPNKSPYSIHNPLFIKELHSARNNSNISHNRPYNTTNIRSSRPNNIKYAHQTQIIPMAKLDPHIDSDEFNQVNTPSKLNDSMLQNKLFKHRRNKHNKLNLQAHGVEQKLRNLISKNKAYEEEIINQTRDTQYNRKTEHQKMPTEHNQQRIQYSHRLKWKSYLFDLKGYSYIKELGKGGYARVILCRHDETNVLYAVKIYDKLLLESKSKISNIKRELSIMAVICNHPNISSLKESIENKTTTFIVMEYCQGHSLFSEIKTSHIQRIPEYRAKSLFRQIINAVVHLKHNKIAHRDIKAENILIHGSTVKLIDFGFSVFCDKHEMIQTFCGTPTYMSPEIVSREPYNPFKSDVWSLGVLLYLMLHGIYPFFSTDESVLFSKIQKGRYKVGDFISSDAREVLRETLIINPQERIDIEDIMKFGWF